MEAPKHPANVARNSYIEIDGLTQPAPVDVDLVNFFAQGDQLTARTSAGDTEFRYYAYGVKLRDAVLPDP